MEFKHDKSWENLKSIYDLKLTAKEAWNKFIEFHEQTNPKTYWTDLKNIDIEAEQIELKQWLEKLIENNPLPKETVALWVGLLKLEDNEMEVPTIYLVGADTYDAEDIDWACEPTYLPENRYGQPALLKEIDEIAKTDENNYEFLDWILPLAYSTFTIDELVRTKLNKTIFLKHHSNINVAVGHDSGDYMNLSTIS